MEARGKPNSPSQAVHVNLKRRNNNPHQQRSHLTEHDMPRTPDQQIKRFDSELIKRESPGRQIIKSNPLLQPLQQSTAASNPNLIVFVYSNAASIKAAFHKHVFSATRCKIQRSARAKMSPLRLIQSLGNSGFNTTVLGSAHQSSYGFSPLGEAENKRHRGKEAVFTGLCLKAPMPGNRSLDVRHSQSWYQHMKAVISGGTVGQVPVRILYQKNINQKW